MTPQDFDKLVEARLDSIRSTLASKGGEYGREDRLHNFKIAARVDNETPERALWGMYKKHLVSVRDIVFDIENGVMPSEKILNEKILDSINYHILLEAIVKERLGTTWHSNDVPATKIITPTVSSPAKIKGSSKK
jgi:hypothetical protein